MDKKVLPKSARAPLALFLAGILLFALGSVAGVSVSMFFGLMFCVAGMVLTLWSLYQNDEKS